MIDYYGKIQQSANYIRTVTDIVPDIGIILGTGLDGLTDVIEQEHVIDYNDIPNFPVSTVEFHKGRLIFGRINDKKIVAMQGRFHYYEGYSMQEITLPVRVMKELGARKLIISGASGSVNPDIKKGEILLIVDHINLLGDNPLKGLNDDRLGERFTDMSQPYDKELMKIAIDNAELLGIPLKIGVYAAMQGPSLETRAEYRFLRIIGADVVGMSTVPEAIVARQIGMDVLGFSIITDECDPDNLKPVKISDILATGKASEKLLTKLISSILKRI